jgi:hypothetical protein
VLILKKVKCQQLIGLTKLSGSMGKAIGSDEKPVAFRNHVYKKSDSGKGANPRPGFYTQQYRDNWEKIFNAKKNDSKENN